MSPELQILAQKIVEHPVPLHLRFSTYPGGGYIQTDDDTARLLCELYNRRGEIATLIRGAVP